MISFILIMSVLQILSGEQMLFSRNISLVPVDNNQIDQTGYHLIKILIQTVHWSAHARRGSRPHRISPGVI